MKKKEKAELLEQLARHGYALALPAGPSKAEEVLLELLRQDDPRLLEGFPVVLANAFSEKEHLDWEAPRWLPQRELSLKLLKRWTVLMALSVLLFRLFGTSKGHEERAMRMLKKGPESEKVLMSLKGPFAGSGEVRGGGLVFSVERLKNNFRNYVVLKPEGKASSEHKEALELELLLSELFTPRQKQLLSKRLAGKTFTKTEREYYYRVVKKRLKALADERVHQLARKLVFA